MSNANEPAFPNTSVQTPNGDWEWGCPGMTKREAFAMAAMQGLCAGRQVISKYDIRCAAIEIADDLLAELERTAKP